MYVVAVQGYGRQSGERGDWLTVALPVAVQESVARDSQQRPPQV
jgi:hypothetical protein